MSKTATDETKDIFALSKQSVNKYFDEFEKTVSKYNQAVSAIQQECCTACEGIIEQAISLQKEFAIKTGFNMVPQEVTMKAIRDYNEEILKACSVENQLIQTATDATKQGIKSFNDNVKAIADLNRQTLQSYVSAFMPARN